MESKIKIRMGDIEIEYEGSESFIKTELLDLIKKLSEFFSESNLKIQPTFNHEINSHEQANSHESIQLSTTSIASKLGAKSATDLALAAAVHLTFAKGKKVFTRQELLDEIKTATSFYKKNYSKNLSQTIKTLLKEKINEISSGKYALNTSTQKDLRSKLA